MADFNVYPALQIPNMMEDRDNQLMRAQQIQGLQNRNAFAPLEMEQQQQANMLGAMQIKALKEQAGRQALVQAADSVDEEDPAAASQWDKQMQALSDAGHPEAKQWIGRYSLNAKEKVRAIYGQPVAQGRGPGGGGAGPGGALPPMGAELSGTQSYDLNKMDQGQLGATLEKANKVAAEIDRVFKSSNPQQEWAKIQAEDPQAAQLGPFDPRKLMAIRQQVETMRGPLQARALAGGLGFPTERNVPSRKIAGDTVVAIDENAPAGDPNAVKEEFRPEARYNPEIERHNREDERIARLKLQAERNGPQAFSSPELVEIDDGQGGRKEIFAQQNKGTGQWVTANDARTPIPGDGLTPVKPGSVGGGRFAGQVLRLLNSAKQATAELKNIAELPVTSTSGFLAGRGQEKGLFNAAKESLTNTVTSQEVQDFNTSMIGMSRALSGLETGGMQPNITLQNQFDALSLKTGDTYITKMRKMATMKQDAINALETTLTSPLLSKKQLDFAQGLIDQLEEAIPWNPADVTRYEYGGNKSESLRDYAKKLGLQPSKPTTAPAAPRPAAMPPQYKIAPDGGYYAPNPDKPGTYLKWQP